MDELLQIDNYSLKIKTRTKTEDGKYTGGFNIRTIGPTDDISGESERIQAIANAVRIGYTEPVIE